MQQPGRGRAEPQPDPAQRGGAGFLGCILGCVRTLSLCPAASLGAPAAGSFVLPACSALLLPPRVTLSSQGAPPTGAEVLGRVGGSAFCFSPPPCPLLSGASRAANLLGSAVCSSSRQAELKRSPGDPAGFSAVDASSKVKAAARCCRPLCPPLKEEFPSRDGSLRIAQGLPSCCGCCRLSACSEAAEENPRPPPGRLPRLAVRIPRASVVLPSL